MNKQEIFNTVWNGFVVQKFERSHDKGICVYRTPDGSKKCAAGMLIPDSEYSPELEGRIVTSMTELPPSLNAIKEAGLLNFVGEIQTIHDVGASLGELDRVKESAELRRLLVKFAAANRLTVPE